MKQTKIAISGKAGSGKDTIAKILQEVNPELQIFRFGDNLKKSLELKFPLLFNVERWENDRDYRNEYIKDFGMTRRELLIKEAMLLRQIHPDYWVKSLFNYLPIDNYIVSDLRFKNELEALKRDKALLIKVIRDTEEINHISERDLDDFNEWDIIINNNGTIEELREKIKTL